MLFIMNEFIVLNHITAHIINTYNNGSIDIYIAQFNTMMDEDELSDMDESESLIIDRVATNRAKVFCNFMPLYVYIDAVLTNPTGH